VPGIFHRLVFASHNFSRLENKPYDFQGALQLQNLIIGLQKLFMNLFLIKANILN